MKTGVCEVAQNFCANIIHLALLIIHFEDCFQILKITISLQTTTRNINPVNRTSSVRSISCFSEYFRFCETDGSF